MSDQIDVTPDGQIVPYDPQQPLYEEALIGPQSLNAPALDVVLITFAPCPPPALTDEKAYMTSKNDKQGFRFRAFNNMSRSVINVCCTQPNGTDQWWQGTIPAPYGFTGGIGLSATGDRLLVDSLAHDVVNPRPRANPRAEGSIEGVYHEDVAAPEDGPGAFVAGSSPAPNPTAPDALTLAGLIDGLAHSHDLRALFGGLMQSAVTSAIVGPLDQWARDRVFEGSTESLRKAGLPPK